MNLLSHYKHHSIHTDALKKNTPHLSALLQFPIDLLTKLIHSMGNVKTSAGHSIHQGRVVTLELVCGEPPTKRKLNPRLISAHKGVGLTLA